MDNYETLGTSCRPGMLCPFDIMLKKPLYPDSMLFFFCPSVSAHFTCSFWRPFKQKFSLCFSIVSYPNSLSELSYLILPYCPISFEPFCFYEKRTLVGLPRKDGVALYAIHNPTSCRWSSKNASCDFHRNTLTHVAFKLKEKTDSVTTCKRLTEVSMALLHTPKSDSLVLTHLWQVSTFSGQDIRPYLQALPWAFAFCQILCLLFIGSDPYHLQSSLENNRFTGFSIMDR